MVLPHLVVFGGSGFLGTQICKAAAVKKWSVTSFSRSGKAPFPPSQQPPWVHEVDWVKADVFNPETYESVLKSADAVVHSMGILLEADYKAVLQGKESPIAGLKKVFGVRLGARTKSKNPLERVEGGEIEEMNPKVPDALTYEMINRDSAIILAKAFSNASESPKKTFLYVSAAAGFPMVPQRYINTKREAERAIEEIEALRGIYIRPGFLYSPDRTPTIPISYLMSVSSAFNNATKNTFSSILGAAASKPLHVEVVGQAVVKAIEDDTIHGIIEAQGLYNLGTRAWREGML